MHGVRFCAQHAGPHQYVYSLDVVLFLKSIKAPFSFRFIRLSSQPLGYTLLTSPIQRDIIIYKKEQKINNYALST